MNRLSVILFCLPVLVSSAKTLVIPPGAYDDEGCITNAGSMINAAYAELADNETLYLPSGHYKLDEVIYMAPRGVKREIASLTGKRGDVILNGCGTTRVIQFGANYQWISSLTITNGYAAGDGGGIWNYENGTGYRRYGHVISNVLITCCSATGKGGGALFGLPGSKQTLTDVEVVSCTATGDGGGLHAEGGIIGTRLFVTNCVSGGAGGGVNLGREIVLNDCVFIGNRATSQGGGIDISNDIGNAITNCVFRKNTSGSSGGGLNLKTATRDTQRVYGCSFVDNSAAQGGGLCASGAAAISHCYFENNSVTGSGGGLKGGDAANVYVHCAFVGNSITSSSQHGGGTSSAATFRHCVWQANQAGFGAALNEGPKIYDSYIVDNVTCYDGKLGQQLGAVTYGSGYYQNCVIRGNRGRTLFNSGVFVNCSIVGNKVEVDNNRGVVSPESQTVGNAVAFTNCVMAENWPWNWSANTRASGADRSIDRNAPPAGQISHCLFSVAGVAAISDGDAYGNLVGRDPKFTDVAAGEFWQKKGSALNDAALEMPWMAGAQDLGEGYEFQFADAEKKTGLIIVYTFSDRKAHKRKLGDAPDIGAFEYMPKNGLILIVR